MPRPLRLAAALLACAGLAPRADAHGMCTEPRSRNYVAEQDGEWWVAPGQDAAAVALIPAPENCAHCLNRGSDQFGSGICGITQVEKTVYDVPKNWEGQPLPFRPQAHYEEGAVITVKSRLTAHHQGHFEMFACPDLSPSQGCFAAHPLEFVSDELYGAPKDPNHPGRAYVAPNTGQAASGYTTADSPGMPFTHKFRLPEGVTGNVILQWRYITGNSCNHAGYHDYPYPSSDWWGPASMGDCPAVLDPTGSTGPEQFWNCIDVTIGGQQQAAPSEEPQADGTPAPEPEPTAQPADAPVEQPVEEPAAQPVEEPAEPPAEEAVDAPMEEPSGGGSGGDNCGAKIGMQPSTWSQGEWQHFIVEAAKLPDDSAGNEVVVFVASTAGKLDAFELVQVWNAVPVDGTIVNKAGGTLLEFQTKQWQTSFGFQARYKSDSATATAPAVAQWNGEDC